MNGPATVWLVERVRHGLPLGRFLHVIETVSAEGDREAGDTLEWWEDPTGALRFVSKVDADRDPRPRGRGERGR